MPMMPVSSGWVKYSACDSDAHSTVTAFSVGMMFVVASCCRGAGVVACGDSGIVGMAVAASTTMSKMGCVSATCSGGSACGGVWAQEAT